MQKYNLFILFLLTSLCLQAQDQNVVVEIEGGASLEEVIQKLESGYGFLFSYKQSDVESIRFVRLPKAAPIETYLENLLKGQGLMFEIVDENYVILTRVDFSDKIDSISLLCGKVIDGLTKKPLAFAHVYLKNTKSGVSSSVDGSFEMSTTFKGVDTLVISYVGYKEKQYLAAAFFEKDCPTVALEYLDFEGESIVVTEYLTDGIGLRNHGAFTELQLKKIGALPGQAEPDVLRTIQFLPGINSPDGTASNINIRGGTSDQNLVLWEDIPVYHTAHYFGMLSAFNPYIINQMSVYRGGFGAEYGGRVSGLIDLKSNTKGQSKSTFGLGTNLISSHANGHLLLNDKGSVIFSLRRSMTELWRSPDFQNITQRIHQGTLVQNIDLNKIPKGVDIDDEFKFFDTNIKANYQITPKDELSAAWFYADSDFSDLILDDKKMQRQEDTLVFENQGFSLSWKHDWAPGFSTKILAVNTEYEYDYGYSLRSEGDPTPDKQGIKNSSIAEQQLNIQNSYTSPEKHQFKLGIQLLNNDVKYLVSRNRRNNPLTVEKKDVTGKLKTIYGSYASPVDRRFGVDAGLRITYFENDSDLCLEPRLRLWYNLSDQLNFHASGGKYFQFLSQLYEIEGDRSSIETPVWTLAGGKEVPVQDATQFQLGLVYNPNRWLFDVQVYTKNIKGLSSLVTDFDEEVSSQSHLGESNIMGIDVLAKKRWKHYQTWVSYTYSKVDYEFPTFFDPTFAAPNDQRHNLSWINMWNFGKFECSLGWRLASGRPYSQLKNFEVVVVDPPGNPGPKEIIRPTSETFNGGRLPMQHQLDASMTYRFQSKQHQNLQGWIGLSLFNVYHQTNIYSREFYIKQQSNSPAQLEYVDKVRMGFTPGLVFGVEW